MEERGVPTGRQEDEVPRTPSKRVVFGSLPGIPLEKDKDFPRSGLSPRARAKDVDAEKERKGNPKAKEKERSLRKERGRASLSPRRCLASFSGMMALATTPIVKLII